MVTTASPYADQRSRVLSGQGYDGVVRVSSGGYFGTGVLLYGGQAVLTAAHLFASSAAAASVHFETSSGAQTVSASSVTILSGYEPGAANNDLALVWLSTAAPTTANRYAPYRGSDEIGQTMTLVGYGLAGSGDAGTTSADPGAPVRLKAANQFDADAAALKSALGVEMGWTPLAGSQLVADFDNGASAQDALGRLIAHPGTGLGLNEGLIAPGDSGGPAFINGSIAGIASYTASLQNGATNPDIDAVSNSSFGEIGAWQRVSHYQQWIDQSLRARYSNAPGTPQQVQKSVDEGGSGTTYAYFLLQFTGVRSDPSQLLSVDYTTRDGSAEAGSDYLAARGTLRLYPGENQAVIAVEIIGDALAETDETFYLDVTNPVGGSFGPDVVTLTAMRTIVNDDGGIWT